MNPSFDWKALPRQPLAPAGQYPKTWPKWGKPRADGRVVDLESLHQSYIYAGDFLGAIGYITPVVIIAVGQLLLGNPLSAITTVFTAATLTNPVAMTCAAFGAIYYGWGALSDLERNELLEKLAAPARTCIP